ncbi:diguanylate cyclase domain-containing protein [Roseateles sp. MS654]|uniref:diguanylate cyclase domain-containing protein n=1 Tax=Roseateles sp. MS654 TaxID=3412685 RepID=UPI003C2CF9D8
MSSSSTATVASADTVEEVRVEHAKPPRQTSALWVPRVDSLAEFGLMISRQLTQCRRYGGQLSVLWLETESAARSAVAASEPGPGQDAEGGPGPGSGDVEVHAALMMAVGRRLRSRVRGTDMVLQVGEASFAVLLLDAGGREAQLVHQRLASALNSPYGVAQGVETRTMQVRFQIGLAAFPEGGSRGADLAESARQDLRRRLG